MTGTVTLWVFGLLCFVVAFAKQAASGAGISLPGPETRGGRVGVVLVGVLALALGAAVRPHDSSPSAGPTPGPASSASVGPASGTPTTSASSVATTPAAATSSSAVVTKPWTGSVGIPSITAGTDIAFDQIPPAPSPGTAETGIYGGYSSSRGAGYLSNSLSGHNLIGVWKGSQAPTEAQCSDWASSNPGTDATVQKGSMVCLKTDDGHVALLTIVSIAQDDSSIGITATATVWAPPPS